MHGGAKARTGSCGIPERSGLQPPVQCDGVEGPLGGDADADDTEGLKDDRATRGCLNERVAADVQHDGDQSEDARRYEEGDPEAVVARQEGRADGGGGAEVDRHVKVCIRC